MCDNVALYTLCSKTGRLTCSPLSVTGNEGEIQTTTAGGLWGAYLMTLAHVYNELANSELAELKAIKSVKLSSKLSSRRS